MIAEWALIAVNVILLLYLIRLHVRARRVLRELDALMVELVVAVARGG